VLPAAPGTAGTALQATVAFFALDLVPETVLAPLPTRARLTLDEEEDPPLRAETSLAARGRAGPVNEGRSLEGELEAQGVRVTRFASLRGALPEGVTARFEAVRDGRGSCSACEPVHERFAVLVHRRGAADREPIELALELEDTHEAACAAGGEPHVRPDRELVLLEPTAPGTYAIVAPSPFKGDEARAILAVVSVAPPPDASCDAAHAEAFAVCSADLAREEALARMRAREAMPVEPTPAPGEQAPSPAGKGAGERAEPRRALLALAQRVRAPLALDLALTGSDELVATAAANVGDGDPWRVEQAALEALRAGATAAEPDEAALRLLARRGGEAARSVPTFFALAAKARSLDAFDRLLARENEDLLEDASPPVRVRAFEWLAARELAPAGYDPLGPAAERRAALEKQEARNPGGVEGGTPPPQRDGE
jgi:hypothetical protein